LDRNLAGLNYYERAYRLDIRVVLLAHTETLVDVIKKAHA